MIIWVVAKAYNSIKKMRADIKAFAEVVAPRKTVIFALQKSIKLLSLLVAFWLTAVSKPHYWWLQNVMCYYQNAMKQLIILILISFASCKNSEENRMKIAEQLGNQRKYLEAIEILDEIILDHPKYMKAYTYKASYLTLLPGKNAEAIRVLDIAIEIDPKCSGCYYTRGLISEGEKSISDLTKAIEMSDKDFEGYYTRGQQRRIVGDFTGAINDYSKTIELKKDIVKSSPILSERAGCYIELKEYKSALIDIDQALKNDSTDNNAYFMRAMYYLKSENNKLKADEDIKKSKKFGHN